MTQCLIHCYLSTEYKIDVDPIKLAQLQRRIKESTAAKSVRLDSENNNKSVLNSSIRQVF